MSSINDAPSSGDTPRNDRRPAKSLNSAKWRLAILAAHQSVANRAARRVDLRPFFVSHVEKANDQFCKNAASANRRGCRFCRTMAIFVCSSRLKFFWRPSIQILFCGLTDGKLVSAAKRSQLRARRCMCAPLACAPVTFTRANSSLTATSAATATLCAFRALVNFRRALNDAYNPNIAFDCERQNPEAD